MIPTVSILKGITELYNGPKGSLVVKSPYGPLGPYKESLFFSPLGVYHMYQLHPRGYLKLFKDVVHMALHGVLGYE